MEKRRKFLKATCCAGATVALSTMLSPITALAAGEKNILSVKNISELSSLQGLSDGDAIFVAGYNTAGDGGAKMVRYHANSNKEVDGGLVHPCANQSIGRFETVHNGIGDFRFFGIFGADENNLADHAFDKMVADKDIRRIEAQSDLWFKKRHIITGRSNLTLDFNNFHVITSGMESIDSYISKDSSLFMEKLALFYFRGTANGTEQTATLKENFLEYTDTFPVPDGFKGISGEWYQIISDNNNELLCKGNYAPKTQEIQRIARIVSNADNKLRFDYRIGYTLKAGRKITYRKITPIADINIINMKFVGNDKGDVAKFGSHPICFEYAVRCHVNNLNCTQTYAACVFRYYNSHFTTENCNLINPYAIASGGKGYFTQQMYCNYGTVRNCNISNGRHLVDSTACAYIHVENCHANMDLEGGFVTHGQFEHDLTFINTTGRMSFAGSGPIWGGSAKNISVKRHSGSTLNAGFNGGNYGGELLGNRITNVTLEDCHIKADPKMFNNTHTAGVIALNCDGVSLKSCSADRMLYLVQNSELSFRPNIIENSTFQLTLTETVSSTQPFLTVPGQLQASASYLPSPTPFKEIFYDRKYRIRKPLTFRNCKFTDIEGHHFNNIAPLYFENCEFIGKDQKSNPLEISCHTVVFWGCKFVNTGIHLATSQTDENEEDPVNGAAAITGAKMQQINLKDCSFFGSDYKQSCISIFESSHLPIYLELASVKYFGGESFITAPKAASIKYFKMTDCFLAKGSSSLSGSAEGSCIIANNIFEDHSFLGLPTKKAASNNSGNI